MTKKKILTTHFVSSSEVVIESKSMVGLTFYLKMSSFEQINSIENKAAAEVSTLSRLMTDIS